MPTRTIGTKVNLSGETEYKKAISEINSGLSVLNSEMKKTTAEFQDNANGMDSLRAKGDVLERQLLSQKEKVEKLREALQSSAEKYGEADSRTQKWAIQLNNAEAAVFNTEAAIKKNNEALEKAGSSSLNLSGIVEGLSNKFGVKLPGGLNDALQSFGGFSTGAIAAIGLVAAAVKGLIDVEKQMIQTTREAAARADDIITQSAKTGLDTETIQAFRYSAELIDVSYETISSSMTKLKNNMQAARDGNESLRETFSKLGVTVTETDGTLRKSEDVFYELVDALSDIDNATERDTTAMDIFGRSAQDLNPLILKGSSVLKEYADEAQAVGYIMSEEMLSALGAVDDEYQKLQLSQESVKNNLAGEFAPAMADVYAKWNEGVQTVGRSLVDSGIVRNLGVILESTMGMPAPLGTLISETLPALGQILSPIAGTFAWIADTLDFISGFLTLDFNKIRTALGQNVANGEFSHMQKWMGKDQTDGFVYDEQSGKWVSNWAPTYNAPGDMNYKGGVTWVGENGPERVWLPQGTAIDNAQDSRSRGGDTYNITIDASSVQEFNDIIRIVKSRRQLQRMGG